MSSPGYTPSGMVFTQNHTAPTAFVSNPPSHLKKFLNGQPKILGAIQILIAMIIFMLGIVDSLWTNSLALFSGVYVWGTIMYLTSGSLCIKAATQPSRSQVTAALTMNVFSALTAISCFILIILDFFVWYWERCSSNSCYTYQIIAVGKTFGIKGVLVVLSLLQLCVSILASAFGCKAVCNNSELVVEFQNYSVTSPQFGTNLNTQLSPAQGYQPSPAQGYQPSPAQGYQPSPAPGYQPSPAQGCQHCTCTVPPQGQNLMLPTVPRAGAPRYY
ncbi:membrane-spanning 4-domains subfamily A member 4D [Amia ocellicauda]|uniref:membrane-spanning 4-domains subfamily A member 4D n=1 Tax=Amia ocellicauda TaxID=2972642 RepID=UPI00346467A9